MLDNGGIHWEGCTKPIEIQWVLLVCLVNVHSSGYFRVTHCMASHH
jgi:hypothetical protein